MKRRHSTYDLARLRPGLKPFRLYWFSTLGSTSDHAAKLRRAGTLYAPALVLTSRQTAGRGRGTNSWWSGHDASDVLTGTFAFPIHERLAPQELPLIAGLAVRDAAAELTGESRILLKWPNDLLHDGLKLAGLLCERVSNVDLVGLGINVNLDPARAPASLRPNITSLLAIGGKALDMTDTLLAIARHLHQAVRLRIEQPFSAFVRRYENHDALAGKSVIVTPSGAEPAIDGRCEGIDSSGRLLVRRRGTLHHIVAGNVMVDSGRRGQGRI